MSSLQDILHKSLVSWQLKISRRKMLVRVKFDLTVGPLWVNNSVTTCCSCSHVIKQLQSSNKHLQSGSKTLMFMCVLDIDECASSGITVCQNGGSCTNTFGSFLCSCSSGFTGNRCQTGAPPLLQVGLVLCTVRFGACQTTLNCRHWQLLNSRIVCTWQTCLLCSVFCRKYLSVDG